MCQCNETKSAGIGMIERPKAMLMNKLEDVGELRSKLSALEEEIINFEQVPGRLADKLRPILPSKPEGVAVAVPTAPSMTEIGSRLQSATTRLREIQSYFHNIISDVQI